MENDNLENGNPANGETKKMKRHVLMIWLVLLAAVLGVSAQAPARFEHLSIEQGLSQSSVNCILQDRRGFMWFGTEEGLNRYDGCEFRVFKAGAGNSSTGSAGSAAAGHISHSTVWTLFEDSGGGLWIGTWDGLNRFVFETETFLHYKAGSPGSGGLSGGNIQAVCEDNLGNLWIGTENSGLNRMNRRNGAFKHYRSVPADPGSLSHDSIRCLFADGEDHLWIGTANGLNRLDISRGTFTHYLSHPGRPGTLSNKDIRSIFRDENGTLWVGTASGLNRWQPKTGTFRRFIQPIPPPGESPGFKSDFVWSIAGDKKETLWLGTDGGGLIRFDVRTGVFSPFRRGPGGDGRLSSDTVQVVYRDRAGLLWLGTRGGGINTFAPGRYKFPHFHSQPGTAGSLSNNSVWTIYRETSGQTWIGTGGGLNLRNPETGKFTVFRGARGKSGAGGSLSDDDVRVVYVDRAGTLWAGTYDGGLNRFDRERRRFDHYRARGRLPGSLSDNRVFALLEDRLGMFWVGTEWGLNLFDRTKGVFIHYLHHSYDPESLSNNTVRSLFEDHSGTLWVGTDGGLNRFDRPSDTFTRRLPAPGQTGPEWCAEILGIYESPGRPGVLWVGTYGGGLYRLDTSGKQPVRRYTQIDGLPNNVVYNILEDGAGNLWLSTNMGLSRFNREKEVFKNYSAGDGLQSNEFNMGAAFKGGDGRLLFGGINGFNMFDPARIVDNPHVPQVTITGFLLFNRPVPVGKPFPAPDPGRRRVILERSVTEGDEIRLYPRENVFSFKFAALDYLSPEDNQYRYKMEGYENQWLPAGKRRSVTYSNLPSGEYVFRVQGSNNDGVWNRRGASINVRVYPAPGNGISGGMLLLYILLAEVIFILIFFGYRFYRKRAAVGDEAVEAAAGETTETAGVGGGAAAPENRREPGDEVDEAGLVKFCEAYHISQREQEIIHLLSQGKKSHEIADLFFISKHTVKNHIYSIYRKVGVKNRVELTNAIRDFSGKPG